MIFDCPPGLSCKFNPRACGYKNIAKTIFTITNNQMGINNMLLSDYDFHLPKKYIAQEPLEKRDTCKLMVLDKKTGKIEHRIFSEIIDYFSPGDCLVINKSKVLPARVYCKKSTGGKIEVLFLEKVSENTWCVLLKDGKSQKEIIMPDGITKAKIVSRNSYGEFYLEFENKTDVISLMKKFGEMPLPPYIKPKKRTEQQKQKDRIFYQTVYAKENGSVASPTAGLHFTEELLEKIKRKGIEIVEIILHIGLATFRPVKTEKIDHHKMLPEWLEIRKESAKIINRSKKSNKKIIAVGTSVTRTLESCSDQSGFIYPRSDKTELYIYPGYKFKCIDMLITNFHLPKSTPFLLVCAFAGKDRILSAYKIAIENNYRFYSYGDAMLIV